MVMEYVKIKNGKFTTPKNIPTPRDNIAYKYRLKLGIIFILSSVLFVNRPRIIEKVVFIGYYAICLLLFLIALEFVRRCCLFFEERNHLKSRYKNSLKKLLVNYIFEFHQSVYIIFLCGIVGLLTIYTFDFKPLIIVEWDLCALALMQFGVLLIKENMHLTTGKLYESIHIKDMKGLDYGSSMAHSYFHGYFKIILPPDGYTSDNLKDLMVKYESDNKIRFQVYKLYILVPLSFFCPNSLKTESSPSILESQTLESMRRNRAGVLRREYKNSVYKIRYSEDRDPIYVCAEYASPLLTFKQAVDQESVHAETYREHKNEIIWNFYNTTRLLLENDPECRDLCELILYDDRDEQGNYIDVGLMLFKKIVKEKMAKRNT